MSRRNRAIALACALTALAVASVAGPAAAGAAGNPIITDCESNGQLTHVYTLSQLRHALASMPASVKQYTNCYDVIQQALIQARKTGTAGPGSGGSGGSFLPTPVLIIIIVLIVVALGLGGLALTRSRGRSGGGGGSPG